MYNTLNSAKPHKYCPHFDFKKKPTPTPKTVTECFPPGGRIKTESDVKERGGGAA